MSKVPHYIRLYDADLPESLIASISKHMSLFCKQHAPDVDVCFYDEESRDMSYRTALAIVRYGFFKCRHDLLSYNLRVVAETIIIRYWGQETDGRDNDPLTGELLQNFPINDDSILDELNCLMEREGLSDDDKEWIDMIYSKNKKVQSAIRKINKKFSMNTQL